MYTNVESILTKLGINLPVKTPSPHTSRWFLAEQVVFSYLLGQKPPALGYKGEENLPVRSCEGDEYRLRGTEEAHRREP